ncbi:hypothetical protein L873DRAFT_1811541, partial [Choiromyces venosus 120613-1]
MSQFLANSQKVETKLIFRINRRQSNTGDTRAVSEIKLKRTDTTLDLSLLDY